MVHAHIGLDTTALRGIRPALTDSIAATVAPSVMQTHILIMQMHSSMALWPATLLSFTVIKIPCLASFYIITQAQLAADSHIFIGSQYVSGFNTKLLF